MKHKETGMVVYGKAVRYARGEASTIEVFRKYARTHKTDVPKIEVDLSFDTNKAMDLLEGSSHKNRSLFADLILAPILDIVHYLLISNNASEIDHVYEIRRLAGNYIRYELMSTNAPLSEKELTSAIMRIHRIRQPREKRQLGSANIIPFERKVTDNRVSNQGRGKN